MLTVRILAVVIILAGIALLNMGHFTFADEIRKDASDSNTGGPVALVERTVTIPKWLSIGFIVVGGIILVASMKKEPK
jgi:uncharacterized membrane protein YidH (DUF202 family)